MIHKDIWESLRAWGSKLSSAALIALNRLCRDHSDRRNAAIQRTGFENRQAASIGIIVTLYFQSVGSYYGFYLYSELHKPLCDRRCMCPIYKLHFDTVYPIWVCECASVCVCVHGCTYMPLLWPSLFLSRHAQDLGSNIFSDPYLSFLHYVLPNSTSSCFRVPLSSPSVTCPPYPSPPSCLPLGFFGTLILLLQPLSLPLVSSQPLCNPHLLLLSPYSLSDNPGKTCWLSYPCTHTMIPNLLSRQQRTQPQQFHPFKISRLEESRENDFLSHLGNVGQKQN